MAKKLLRMQKAARAYLSKTDWFIFPLAPGTKITLKGSSGFLDATNDPEEAEGWFECNPNLNLAVATGEVVVVVWDLYKEGVEEAREALKARYGPFQETLTAITPRGGLHEYYLNTKDVHITCKNSFPHGVDLKAHGGYIVLPPSNVGGVEYRWKGNPDFNNIAPVPEWMYQFFGPKRDAGGRFIAKSTDEWSRLAQPVYEGGRHERILIVTGFLLRVMRAQAPLAEALVHAFNEKYCLPPLPTSDVERIFDDIATKELTKLEKALSGGASCPAK